MIGIISAWPVLATDIGRFVEKASSMNDLGGGTRGFRLESYLPSETSARCDEAIIASRSRPRSSLAATRTDPGW
jgi:hypothetical protein